MSIDNKFKGLDFKQLIGVPIKAATESNKQLAKSTADFIQSVGFDKKEPKAVSFEYMSNDDRNNKTNIDVPLLALVPIPNLQTDEVNILFDMEVKDNAKDNINNKRPINDGNLGSGIFGVNINKSVSSHFKNTKNDNNASKYQINVKSENEEVPEGIKKLLQIMNENVSILNNKDKKAENDKLLQENISLDNSKEVDELIEKSIEKIELYAKIKIEYYSKIYNQLIEESNNEEDKIKYKNTLDIFINDIDTLVNDFKTPYLKNINPIKYEMIIDNIDKSLIKEPIKLEDDPLFQIINDIILLKSIKDKAENK